MKNKNLDNRNIFPKGKGEGEKLFDKVLVYVIGVFFTLFALGLIFISSFFNH